jgi:fumarate hydratase class II
MDTRIEKDSMGEMNVPIDALYGAQTRRAELNFPISGYRMPSRFISALALIKHAFAIVHRQSGTLDFKIAELIEKASTEIINGQHHDQFIVDVFQTGSGTSSNMNMNEVISNLAIKAMGGNIGSKDPVHPNDHVNKGQSSNDVIPSAIHIAACTAIRDELMPALEKLEFALNDQAVKFNPVVKIGRTHLMDATPIRMGQIFSGYSEQVRKARERMSDCFWHLTELPLGGTAVGTGLNTSREITQNVIQELVKLTDIEFMEVQNHFEAQATKDIIVETSATLKRIGISIGKIANDIRFLGSGPRCGLGELYLPAAQPGSSIMPGKVNPVICESVMQVSAFLVGADAGISHAAATLSNFELSVAMPFMAFELLESMRILANVCNAFTEKCIEGLDINRERCADTVELSLAMVTSLVPIIGYDKAAQIAKEAWETGRNIREVAYERNIADKETIDKALDAFSMTQGE